MLKHKESVVILCAEDDPDDRTLIKDAMEEVRLINELHFVENGEELMDYLHRRGEYQKLSKIKLPGLILIDLNMPKKDGFEAIKEIKSDPSLRKLPIVVLTTSKAEEDIVRTYNLGANSYITKPVTFENLVNVVKVLNKYWFDIVELPI